MNADKISENSENPLTDITSKLKAANKAKRVRLAKLPIRRDKTGKWCYDLPASISETGRRQRKFFETEKLAKLARGADLDRQRKYGIEGCMIPASLAQDAKRASKLLAPYDVTLYQAAKAYAQSCEKLSRSETFAKLWGLFIESREAKSSSYNRTLAALGKKLLPVFGARMVSTITHDELREFLRKTHPTAYGFNAALRSVSPAFSIAVKEGWTDENPCRRIDKIDTGRHEIEVMTLEQCRALFRVCKDYREDKSLKEYRRMDCRRAKPALALMLFAGVRPKETERLDWADIDMGEKTVLVRNTKAKTDRSRYFKMPDVLAAWLEAVPIEDRSGPIITGSWKRVYSVVREKAGISGMHDPLRKTFATAHLGAHNDVNLTRSIMGHEVGDVLFTHYRGLMKPKEAREFWNILPGTENGKLEVVA